METKEPKATPDQGTTTDHSEAVATLQAQVEELTSKMEDVVAAMHVLHNENKELKSALASAGAGQKVIQKPTIPTTPFTVGKKKYKFRVAQFRGKKGVIITAKDAMSDPELLKELVDKYNPDVNAGVIIEVED